MDNSVGVKRSWPPYFFNVVVVIFSLWKGLHHVSMLSRVLWFILFGLASATLIGFLLHRHYIEIKNNRLTIYRGLLQKSVIDLEQIDHVEINAKPFKPSVIWLKNQEKVGFNEGLVDGEELRQIFKSFGIRLT